MAFFFLKYLFYSLENDLGEIETSWILSTSFYFKIDFRNYFLSYVISIHLNSLGTQKWVKLFEPSEIYNQCKLLSEFHHENHLSSSVYRITQS